MILCLMVFSGLLAYYFFYRTNPITFTNESKVLTAYSLDVDRLTSILKETDLFNEGLIPWEENTRVYPKKILIKFNDNLQEGQISKNTEGKALLSIRNSYHPSSKIYTISLAVSKNYLKEIEGYSISENTLSYSLLHSIITQQEDNESFKKEDFMNIYRNDASIYTNTLLKNHGYFLTKINADK